MKNQEPPYFPRVVPGDRVRVEGTGPNKLNIYGTVTDVHMYIIPSENHDNYRVTVQTDEFGSRQFNKPHKITRVDLEAQLQQKVASAQLELNSLVPDTPAGRVAELLFGRRK